jgi:DNA-directed RNA polymerase specialized sigma subunit
MRRGTKLTYREALEIRYLAQKEDRPQHEIARAYQISRPHVSNIKAERRWPTLARGRGRG